MRARGYVWRKRGKAGDHRSHGPDHSRSVYHAIESGMTEMSPTLEKTLKAGTAGPCRHRRGMRDLSVVIKGAGEMASGIAHRLFMANITRICMIEIERPLCVRRTVSFCEAVYNGETEVEGVVGRLVCDRADLGLAWERGQIGVIVDPAWKIVADIMPDVIVDAIMAKKNLGTYRDEAPLVIGVGPGFSAPHVVHAVVESNRGANLGRAIYNGAAEAHTGIPALTAGFSRERVLRSPHSGLVRHVKSIGDPVTRGDTILYVDDTPVTAAIDGVVRGLIRDIRVWEDEKVGDIEPRGDASYCLTISDKARAIGGGVLEAIMHYVNRPADSSQARDEREAGRGHPDVLSARNSGDLA